MDYLEALQLKAFLAVTKPDWQYFVRRTMRWYSKTFSTPLHVVEDIPLEDILQAWYEEEFAGLNSQQLDEERSRLIESEQERAGKIKAEEEAEVEMFEAGKVLAAEESAKRKSNEIAQTMPKAGPIVQRDLAETTLGESVISSAEPLPPDITMTFVSPDELDRELEGFGNMTGPDDDKR